MLTVLSEETQAISQIYEQAIFKQKIELPTSPQIFKVDSPLYNVRFFPFKKLKRYFHNQICFYNTAIILNNTKR